MKTSSHNICNAMRDCGSLSHSELEDVLACLASTLQRSDLGSRCITVVVDMVDEITGQIQDDLIEQHEDVSGFTGTYAALGKLTIRTEQ